MVGFTKPAELNAASEQSFGLYRFGWVRRGRQPRRRGELFKRLPVGYTKDGAGKIVLHPDRRVGEAIRLVFTKFRELWSVRQTLPYPYVNHFSFHILDRDWGHITIKISGHPPFPAQIILNGHEYVQRQAAKAGIQLTIQTQPPP